MTVDEVGRSLVILLPTCPDPEKPDECWTGSIEVSTDEGYVLMNQAYQATMVSSRGAAPSEPAIIDIEESLIDNMLIVSPPRTAVSSMSRGQEDSDENGLDHDFLEYQELTENYLDEDILRTSELEINRLDIDFLDNLLDHSTELDVNDSESDSVLPTVNRHAWVQWAYNEETIFLYSERTPHIAEVTTDVTTNGTVNITQDGVAANIQLNDGGTGVSINIVQNQ
jgi:hypothetical protein